MNRPRHPTERRTAFTLIELLVVVGIIGLLVALLIPAVGKVRRAAQGAATQAQMAAIATAIQSYYSDFRAYPGPLPNVVLGSGFYKSPATSTPANIVDYVSAFTTPSSYTYTNFTDTPPNHDYTEQYSVTGSENLVLGLLGGLELEPADLTKISFDPYALFPGGSGSTANPQGPENLNQTQLKRFAAYLQVKPGDISTGLFTDQSQRICNDTRIPEFLDKYSQAMPILYLRANPGALGIATAGGLDENSTAQTYQYDLAAVIGYTKPPTSNSAGAIGTTFNDPTRNHHGLLGIDPNLVNTSTTPYSCYPLMTSGAGASDSGTNGLVYLRDPNMPTQVTIGGVLQKNTNATGYPRQKDAFLLVSPGPDGVYGTADDLIYPGTLNQ